MQASILSPVQECGCPTKETAEDRGVVGSVQRSEPRSAGWRPETAARSSNVFAQAAGQVCLQVGAGRISQHRVKPRLPFKADDAQIPHTGA